MKPTQENSLEINLDLDEPLPQPKPVEPEVSAPAIELPDDYHKHHYLIKNGKIVHITKASAYLFDMMVKSHKA